MSEERRMILQMVQEGAVSIDEAERLLDAVPKQNKPVQAFAPQRIRVQVTEEGRKKINVKLPFSLVRAGLKLGKSFGALGLKYDQDSPAARQAMDILQDLDIDELLASIGDGEIVLPYHIVDIDDSGEGEGGTQVTVVLE